MQVATCISAYGFLPFYLLILFATVSDKWSALRLPIGLFIGAKLYAICFYHLMEFTSDQPPPELIPYVSVEGPYLLSILLIILKLWSAVSADRVKPKYT